MLGVPVIASVGHHTDRTLLDDVAAVSCSTPTHAADATVMIDCAKARSEVADAAKRLRTHGERTMRDRAKLPVAAAQLRTHTQRALRERDELPVSATRLRAHAERATAGGDQLPEAARRLSENGRRAVLTRARLLASFSRAPGEHVDRERVRLHQQLREIRAGGRRRVENEQELTARRALVLARKGEATTHDCRERRLRELSQLALALEARDPQRTLERGYALVESRDGEPVTGAAAARSARAIRLRFADGTLPAQMEER
jgi:exodeoxyribonuclease VII large subunit